MDQSASGALPLDRHGPCGDGHFLAQVIAHGLGFDAKPGRVRIRVGAPVDTATWTLADLDKNREALRSRYVEWNQSRALARPAAPSSTTGAGGT